MRWIAALLLACCTQYAVADNREAVIDWSRWDDILAAHVVDGHVDYDAIAGDEGFEATVRDIADASLEGQDRDALLAFYINAYNVLAVQGILNGHSPTGSFGKLRFFFRDKYTVAGERMNLDRLEDKRIRTLGEPRIHFAIVCASASCPKLQSEAFLPGRLDEQLEAGTRAFINDQTKNRFEEAAGVARVSKIFKWFDEDFEAAGGVQSFLAGYVNDEGVVRALRERRFDLKYLDYDWSLNGSFEGLGR
jgi:hypothetical protein